MSMAQRLRELAVSESGFVFDPVTGFTFSVNGTGLCILAQLREGKDADAVIEALHDAFDATDRDDLVRDLGEFVRSLKDQGLLPRDAEV